MKKISWFTPSNIDASGERWYSQGYSIAAVKTIQALQQIGVPVFYDRPDIYFHINFCQPMYYQLNRGYTIGYTPWETDKVPTSWKIPMSKCDEIWATSSWVKEVYEKNNLHHNIHVIPHGVDENFSIVDREILNNKFYFLHVGGDSKRKNAQLVVDAFLELFDGVPEYNLILKYNNFCHAEMYMNGHMVKATDHPQIHGIGWEYDQQQMVDLYHKCHCLVYPTSGEGFGMIPLEAIATGMPSIVTNLTGTADIAKFSIPLNASWEEATYQSHIYGDNTGMWASPDCDELLNLMVHVVNEYDDFKKYTIQSARILHQEHSWTSTALKILDRLQVGESYK